MSHRGGPGPWMSLTCKNYTPYPAQPRLRATARPGCMSSQNSSAIMPSPTFCLQKAEGLLAEVVLQEKEGWQGGPPSTLGG